MANLINKLSMLFSFKQIINFVFFVMPLIIIGISLIKLIKSFKKDELFILCAVRILICLIVMMIPALYNTSSLLKKNNSSNITFENDFLSDDLVFDYTNIVKEDVLKRVFIGDSRTVGMYNAVYGGSDSFISTDNEQEIWYAKVSAGYTWFINNALNQINSYLINDNFEFIILMGANDLYNADLANKYISIISEYANNYPESKFVFVSVNPINDEASLNHGYSTINQNVIDFNSNLINSINNLNLNNIFYCDTYKKIIDDFETSDGLHYSAQTYKKIYNIIDTCL